MSAKRELTRAEQVRARRAQQVNQAMHHTSQRPFKPVAHVTSRMGTSLEQRSHQRAPDQRRLFTIPRFNPRESISGVRQPRDHWRTASFLLAVAIGAALYLMWTLPYFHVPAVTVLGNVRMSREDIEAVLGITGQSIFLVQPADLAARLRLNYPELISAEVDAYLPNYVYVSIAERQPVILWQQDQGITWIDAEGVAFRPRGQVDGLVPVVGLANPPAGVPSETSSLSPPPFMQKELVDAILLLGPSVPAGSILMYDPVDGLGWTDDRGWQVFFGIRAQEMPLKLRVYESLLASLEESGKVPEYINVAFPDAPYYRMTEYSDVDSMFDTGQ
jgi:hypothetical protein